MDDVSGVDIEDMLAWFEPHERSRCAACETDGCITLDAIATKICLRCGAVWAADGRRLDLGRAILAGS
jgi:hypothetical protein